MRKSDRLFQLTNILRAYQPISARMLSEKLGVSERTIYRYIDDLSVSGIPIYGEPGVGYRLSEGFELPPLQLTPLELEALILGVNMVATRTGDEFAKAARSLLCKIEAAVPDHAITHAQPGAPSAQVPVAEHHDIRHMWGILYQAIKEKQHIFLMYQSLAETHTERIVYPLGLFYWGGKWTLGAWCTLRMGYRDFRIDRIEHITQTAAPSPLPLDVNLENYLAAQNAKD
ncbi:helix-turn-helix transcriptional regulator [Chrysiogenes arsenatis]|uniref:helix-turn-helix transcriptional regulator n=1 Tax=Chrysiogenes arsenatis TaxID=309797 RepID=UPI000424A8EC|nr:YafY family protein [Chrysiogenes arsenatis]